MSKKIAVLILMIAAAIITVVAGAIVSRNLKIKNHGVSVESVVRKSISNTKSHLRTVTVAFRTDTNTEITASGTTRQRLAAGDKVSIWYDKMNPQKITFGDSVSYNMRGVIIGGLLFLFGLYYFIRFSLNDRSVKKLIKTGRKISTEFVSVDRNEKYNMGDKNPWVIKCRWVDEKDNREYLFRSKDYTIDPAPYLEGLANIDVYIDAADPCKYYMDASFMPKGNNTIG
jgi:hypothetical protein